MTAREMKECWFCGVGYDPEEYEKCPNCQMAPKDLPIPMSLIEECEEEEDEDCYEDYDDEIL